MPLPRLPLSAPAALPQAADLFPGEGPVAWLGTDELPELHAGLGARCWSVPVHAVAVPGPPPGTNPFSHRPDRYAPLRWGPIGEDRRTLDEAGAPSAFEGLVLCDVLRELPGQAARTLLEQLGARLPSGAPWVLVERNGRYAPEVLANLRRDDDQRGEGKGTLRTVEELRRLLEPAGFGIAEARARGGRRRDRLLQRAFGADTTSMWLVVQGQRI